MAKKVEIRDKNRNFAQCVEFVKQLYNKKPKLSSHKDAKGKYQLTFGDQLQYGCRGFYGSGYGGSGESRHNIPEISGIPASSVPCSNKIYMSQEHLFPEWLGVDNQQALPDCSGFVATCLMLYLTNVKRVVSGDFAEALRNVDHQYQWNQLKPFFEYVGQLGRTMNKEDLKPYDILTHANGDHMFIYVGEEIGRLNGVTDIGTLMAYDKGGHRGRFTNKSQGIVINSSWALPDKPFVIRCAGEGPGTAQVLTDWSESPCVWGDGTGLPSAGSSTSTIITTSTVSSDSISAEEQVTPEPEPIPTINKLEDVHKESTNEYNISDEDLEILEEAISSGDFEEFDNEKDANGNVKTTFKVNTGETLEEYKKRKLLTKPTIQLSEIGVKASSEEIPENLKDNENLYANTNNSVDYSSETIDSRYTI